jgi:hypothetical protein
MVFEAVADTLHFQTFSRTKAVIDAGQIDWTPRVSV